MWSENGEGLTLESIESALREIEGKKESLKKAFEELQSETSLIPSLSVSWADLDAHFTAVQQSLTHQFRLLQSLDSPQLNHHHPSASKLGFTRVNPEHPSGSNLHSDRNDSVLTRADPKIGDPSGSKVNSVGKGSVLSRVDPVGSTADPKKEGPSGSKVHSDGKGSVLSPVDPVGSKADPKKEGPSGSKVYPDGKSSVLSRVDPVGSKADPKKEDPSGSKVHSDRKGSVLRRVDPVGSKADPNKEEPSGSKVNRDEKDSVGLVVCRAELKRLCERMDGGGLREYIDKSWEEREQIRVELVGALECASDPALLVLDSVEAFYGKGRNVKGKRGRSCEMMLEALVDMRNVEVSGEVRERAKGLVSKWKRKDVKNRATKFHILGLLKLMGAFRLRSELSFEEFIDYLVDGKPKQAANLCQLLGFEDKIIDIINTLFSKNVPLMALELVMKFELTKEFQPVVLLNTYIRDSKKRAKKVCEDGNNAGWTKKVAISVELNALKAVHKFIGAHNLESEYPLTDLEKLIEQLEKRKDDDEKRHAAAPAFKSKEHKKQQQPPQSGNKRPRMIPPVEPREVLPLHPSHSGSAGFVPDRHAPYLSSPDVPYGLAGSVSSVVSLMGTSVGLYGSGGTSAGPYGSGGTSAGPYGSAGISAGPYGSARVPAGIYVNQIPASSQLHSSESYITSGYYDRLTAYGGYGGLPQYYPPNYRQ